MSFKVPSFISTYFGTLSHDEKKEAIERYKKWQNHDYTKMLVEHLEETRTKLINSDEDKNDFISKFQFTSTAIRSRAKRSFIKDLIKKLDWKL